MKSCYKYSPYFAKMYSTYEKKRKYLIYGSNGTTEISLSLPYYASYFVWKVLTGDWG